MTPKDDRESVDSSTESSTNPSGLASESRRRLPSSSANRIARKSITPPDKQEYIYDAIKRDYDEVNYRSIYFNDRAVKWDLFSKVSSLIVAFCAGASTISFFSDWSFLTAIFSIATTAVSAINVSFDPSKAAKDHREASKKYERLLRSIDELLTKLESNDRLKDDEKKNVWEVFLGYRMEIDEINDIAPSYSQKAIEEVAREDIRRQKEWEKDNEILS